MNTLLDMWPIFGMVGSVGGAATVVKYIGAETKRKLERHELTDNGFHAETVDRLARLETKLDIGLQLLAELRKLK